MHTSEITVIGSVNIDIHGEPFGRYLPEDSNPGTIHMTIGGVGCNIARNLSFLGHEVRFISAIGDDPFSLSAKHALEQAGLDYSHSVFVPGGKTSCYIYITDETGSMVSGVSDMAITDALTPEALEERLPVLNAGGPVVFDANLSEASIRFLVEKCTSPLIADSVSAAKTPRLRSALHRLSLLKCNRMEALELTGTDDVAIAAQRLVDMGVERVFITLGERGVCCADRQSTQFVPGFIVPQTLDSTGAGDSFLAGALHMTLKGARMYGTARFAAAAAAYTCTAGGAVHPDLNEQTILQMSGDNGFYY